MNGITIFNHSVRQVVGNIGMAVRVSWWFVAFIMASMIAVFILVPAETIKALLEARQNMDAVLPIGGREAAMMMLAGMAFLVVALWSASLIAIVWHRFILLEDHPRGIIPYRKEYNIGRYFWYGAGVWFVTIVAGAVIAGILFTFLGPVMMGVGDNGGNLANIVGALITGIIITVLYLRLALVLPSVALEDGLKMADAWNASKGFSGAIAVAGITLTIMNIVFGYVTDFLLGLGLPDMLISGLELGYNWFYFMLNISILSTLYGHIVQKREVY